VREIDGRELGDPGPITTTIQQRYFSIVKGEDEKYYDWLDFVE
jgi:branched-chain amino acid aminotransferase